MKIYRTSLNIVRLCVLWVGVSLFATGADAATIQSLTSRVAPTLEAGTKTSASAKARARAARIRAARARASRSSKALAEAKVPRFRTDDAGNVVPDVRAAAAIIYDPATGKVLYEENAMDERSIASITKVMTAIVFLETATDLNQEVQIVRADTLRASTTYLRTNDRVRVADLLHLLLIPSDNAAARALARISPLGYDGFIARMNQKADDLGLHHTAYIDPSGLYADNISSAYDMARLISFASEDDRIGPIMRTPEYLVPHHSGRQSFGPHRDRPQHQPDPPQRRNRRAWRQDRLHHQGGLLPGDAPQDAQRVLVCGCRAWRDVEPGPVLGNASPDVVALRAHRHDRACHARSLNSQVESGFSRTRSST